MKRLLNKTTVLVCIFLLGLFLRIYKVPAIPGSLSWDEVSIGYNAYSILKTGFDEHHRFMPIDAFVAYGDYKPPLSIYLTVPFVAVFGLNEFSVRLPSVLFGSFTVLLTYFLVKALFPNKMKNSNSIRSKASMGNVNIFEYLPLLSSFLLAISPWHINLSRAAFEANIASFFIVLGVTLVLYSRKKPILWLFSWLPFVAAIYTFNSSRYFVPFLSIGLSVFLWKDLMQAKKNAVIGILLSMILVIPIVPHLLSKEARLRYEEVNIFSNPAMVETANARIAQEGGGIIANLVNNRRIEYGKEYLNHFFDHFQPSFLFVKGDGNPKFSTQNVGQLFWLDAVFLPVGILALSLVNPGVTVFLLFWIIASIVPAATARETPHALRILNSLPVWQIFIAYGMLFLGDKASKLKYKKLPVGIFFVIVCFMIYAFNFFYYIHNYYRHYTKEYVSEWQYGYREAIEYTESVKDQYDAIVITEKIGRPYMYTLFYTKYPPEKYWETKKDSFDAAGFYHVYGYDTYQFINGSPKEYQKRTLYIGDPSNTPEDAVVKQTIRYPNGEPVLSIFEI